MRKHKLGRALARRHDQDRDQDDEHGGAGPVDADLVDQIQIPRPKRVHARAHKHHSPEAEDSLPLVRDKVLIKNANRTQNKLRAAEVDAQRDGPVSHQRQPAIHEADHRRPAGGGEHGGPVVDAAGGRVDGADLGEGGGDAEGDDGDEDPAPEDGDGLAVGEGDVHCRGEAEGHGHDGEGEAEDGEHGKVARELGLVAQAGEGLVGGDARGRLAH